MEAIFSLILWGLSWFIGIGLAVWIPCWIYKKILDKIL